MALIRARQRVITALTPHQGNRRFIVPKRGEVAAPTTWRTVCTLVAGDTGPRGYSTYGGTYGSMSPIILDNTAGDTIRTVITFGSGTTFQVLLDGTAADTDATFSQVEVAGVFEGGIGVQTYSRSARSLYQALGVVSEWRFGITLSDRMIGGNTYSVTWDGDL